MNILEWRASYDMDLIKTSNWAIWKMYPSVQLIVQLRSSLLDDTSWWMVTGSSGSRNVEGSINDGLATLLLQLKLCKV